MRDLDQRVEFPSHRPTVQRAEHTGHHRSETAVATWMRGNADTPYSEPFPDLLPAGDAFRLSVEMRVHCIEPERNDFVAQLPFQFLIQTALLAVKEKIVDALSVRLSGEVSESDECIVPTRVDRVSVTEWTPKKALQMKRLSLFRDTDRVIINNEDVRVVGKQQIISCQATIAWREAREHPDE